MGGAQMGSLFDGMENTHRSLESLHPYDVRDVYVTDPYFLAEAAKKAIEGENPELGFFIAGVLAARSLETPLPKQIPWKRGEAPQHPSEQYSYLSYRKALQSLFPSMVEITE